MITNDLWLVVDNEGCLTPGKGQAFDLPGALKLRRFLELRPNWRFTIATGRSAPYTEALWQFIGCPEGPHIVEGGALLYWPETGLVERLGQAWEPTMVEEKLRHLPFDLEAGKINCLSFYPRHGKPMDWVRECNSALGALTRDLEITCSSAALDITASGVSKGSALDHLRQRLGLKGVTVATFGDGLNDLSMHFVADLAACPSNADPCVRQQCAFVAKREHILGLLEFVELYGCL